MSPLDMCWFGAVIFAVVKVIELALVWYKEDN
jgi:hypothetical protein